MADHDDDAPLTADEVLTFGPCVEAVAWHPVFIAESRAPIAVAVGRPKLGRVFDDRGIGKAAVIRPCVSRGARIRGLPPIYTPQMLESHAGVFGGWPMFLDHVPAPVTEAMAKRGRSVKDLGGQALRTWWQRDFVHEDDGQYGYQRGAVLGEIWATPMIREMVGENPNLLHTSIKAWPTSGKPSTVPWRPNVKGMMIEGIRSQPAGSVDFVVRGGAGGRLLLQEGLEEEGAWPEIGEWSEDDQRLVVSIAERLYATRHMPDAPSNGQGQGQQQPLTLPQDPGHLRGWIQEHAAHLMPAFATTVTPSEPATPAPSGAAALTESDVRQIVQESASSNFPTVEEFEQRLAEQTDALIAEREHQRELAAYAVQLIESADGLLPTWKADLSRRYQVTADGVPDRLLIEGEAFDGNGNQISDRDVVKARVEEDLKYAAQLIAEAQGRPRVTGEGGARRDPADGSAGRRDRAGKTFWRERFAEMRLVESADKALDLFGEAEG